MARDPDANPLHSKEENGFLEAMLDDAERRSTVPVQPTYLPDRAAFVEDLDKRMQQADWYYEYSDDFSVWQKGSAAMKGIKADLHTLSMQPNGWSEARQLWERNTPPHSEAIPAFLQVHPEQQKLPTNQEKSMKIEGQDAKDIQSLLQESMDVGLTYMVYNRESAAFKPHEGYPFFDKKEEAQWSADFFSQRSGQEHVVLPMLAIEQRLGRELELQAIRNPGQAIPKDMVIDEGFILKQETAREQIFTKQLKEQLEQQGIKAVDGKALAIHIEQDKQQFDVNAVRSVNGKDELLTVHIRQNPDRAFEVASILPGMQPPQKETVHMEQGEVLGGTIQPDKALELKQYLQAEKEAGNRFVAFEGNQPDLIKDHFQGFKSAHGAMEFSYENTNDKDRFIVRSIAVVEKEIDNILEGKQRSLLQQPEMERDNKRSRDQELSR